MEQTYTIILTKSQLDTIGNALAEIPFKFAAPVLNEINRQFSEQLLKVEDKETP